jgi:hypothetical protein
MILRRLPPYHAYRERTNAERSFLLTLFFAAILPAVALTVLPASAVIETRYPSLRPAMSPILLGALALSYGLLYPLFAIADTLLYFDIRRRYEGFDVEAAGAALSQQDAGSPESADEGRPQPPEA